MTWKELILAMRPEQMPRVEWNDMRGTITEIKHSKKHKGVTVQFDGVNWGTWFWDDVTNDKRSRDISELKLVGV